MLGRRGSQPRATRAIDACTSRHELRAPRRRDSGEGVALRVDALQGSRDSFSVFLFHLGLCTNACGKVPVGDTVELFKCCRVSV